MSGHPLRGAGQGAAAQRVRAEAARGVGRVSLGVGHLLVAGFHGGRDHVEHDDGRAHGLAKHVLSSGEKNGNTSPNNVSQSQTKMCHKGFL